MALDWLKSPFPPAAGFRETRLLDFDVTIFDPPGKHTATVFWLHGLGGSSGNLVPGVQEIRKHLSTELGDGIKFILPNAPKMKVTGNFSQVMPSWFDCYSFDIEHRTEDALGLATSADWLDHLIDLELSTCPHLPPARVVVGGISQGAAVVCRTVVGTERTLAGAFVVCGYVPLRKRVVEMKTPLASTIPIFWGHGTLDPQVSFTLALRSAKQLAVDLGIGFVQSGITPLRLEEVLAEDCVHLSGGTNSTSVDGIGIGTGTGDPGTAGKDSVRGGEGEQTATPLTATPKLRFVYYPTLGHWYSDDEMRDLAVWLNGILGNPNNGRREKGVEAEGGEGPEEGGSEEGGGAAQTGPGDDSGNASALGDGGVDGADGGE